MVGAADSVLIREVSFIQRVLYREVLLYQQALYRFLDVVDFHVRRTQWCQCREAIVLMSVRQGLYDDVMEAHGYRF